MEEERVASGVARPLHIRAAAHCNRALAGGTTCFAATLLPLLGQLLLQKITVCRWQSLRHRCSLRHGCAGGCLRCCITAVAGAALPRPNPHGCANQGSCSCKHHRPSQQLGQVWQAGHQVEGSLGCCSRHAHLQASDQGGKAYRGLSAGRPPGEPVRRASGSSSCIGQQIPP